MLGRGWLPEHETVHLPVTTLSVGWPKYGPEAVSHIIQVNGKICNLERE